MSRTPRLVAAAVAVAVVVPVAAAEAAGERQEAVAEGGDEPEGGARSGRIEVKVKGLKQGKVKLKSRSSTFDRQELRKLTKATKVRARGKAPTALLRLTPKGRDAVESCESRKIVVSGNGVKKVTVPTPGGRRPTPPPWAPAW